MASTFGKGRKSRRITDVVVVEEGAPLDLGRGSGPRGLETLDGQEAEREDQLHLRILSLAALLDLAVVEPRCLGFRQDRVLLCCLECCAALHCLLSRRRAVWAAKMWESGASGM